MIFTLSLAAAAVAAGAVTMAAREKARRRAAAPPDEEEHEPFDATGGRVVGSRVIGGRWDGLPLDPGPGIAPDEVFRVAATRDGEALVSTRANRAETAWALRAIAAAIEDEEA